MLHHKFVKLATTLLKTKTLHQALHIASAKIKDLIKVDRVTIFIYSKKNNVLWTYLADGIETFSIPANKGIVGYVVKNKILKVVNDTNKEPLFYKEIDKMSGYKTKNILTLPLSDIDNNIIGVVQLLNKKNGFNETDIKIAKEFVDCITPPFEILISEHKYSDFI